MSRIRNMLTGSVHGMGGDGLKLTLGKSSCEGAAEGEGARVNPNVLPKMGTAQGVSSTPRVLTMFLIKTVHLTTLAKSDPPALITAVKLARACLVCSSTPPSTTFIVSGTSGIAPLPNHNKLNQPILTAHQSSQADNVRREEEVAKLGRLDVRADRLGRGLGRDGLVGSGHVAGLGSEGAGSRGEVS